MLPEIRLQATDTAMKKMVVVLLSMLEEAIRHTGVIKAKQSQLLAKKEMVLVMPLSKNLLLELEEDRRN